VLQQLKQKVAEEEAGEEENPFKLDDSRTGGVNKKNSPKKSVKRVKKSINREDPNLKLLADLADNPLSADEALLRMGDYLSELTAGSGFKHLDDFVCHKILQAKPSVLEAAADLEKLIDCLTKNVNHPTCQQYCRILGLNGFRRMSEGKFQSVLELREGLIRESGATLGEAIPLNSTVEFLRKHFRNVSISTSLMTII